MPPKKTSSIPLQCHRIPGMQGSYCVPAQVAKAAGVKRQAVDDAMRRGRISFAQVAIYKLIPEAQARDYISKARARKSKPRKATPKPRIKRGK